MAKTFKIKESIKIEEQMMLSQAFRGVVSIAQVGDRFYVPTADMLLITGTPSVAYSGTGDNRKPVLDDQGNNTYNQSAQRILAVRLDGKNPVDVVEVFVGQLAKQDYKGRFVFPESPFVKALRGANPDAAMKDLICNRILQIGENAKTFTDRKWDDKAQTYERDENNRLVAGPEKTINEWLVAPLLDVDAEACKAMLLDYYKKNYPNELVYEE